MQAPLGTDLCACTARPRCAAHFALQPPVFAQHAVAHDGHNGRDGDVAGGQPWRGFAGIKTIVVPSPLRHAGRYQQPFRMR
jgi:hypothetical protein